MKKTSSLRNIANLCVFCGSSEGRNPLYMQAAHTLAIEMANRRINLVYGGGGAGIMGKLSSTLRHLPVSVVGIIPDRIYEMVRHLDHAEDELIVVGTMHERKGAMYERSDAFVALPGGIGTLEELMEALTWLQLGYHEKPVGILNTAGFFDPLIAMLHHMVDEGFLRMNMLESLVVESEPKALLDSLERIDLTIPQKIST
ncbi:TIGR00730 family Rossman fold protein [Pleomorphochaeta sp. DL1XJH-081]|uniref:LOG family protein n=1 Tax=Pleomorphochaeta sp. DL1XJH-081 TaxID=3409690 RepID=UPI003BB7734A